MPWWGCCTRVGPMGWKRRWRWWATTGWWGWPHFWVSRLNACMPRCCTRAAALNKGPQPDESQLRVVLRYLQALNAQMSQAALCRLQHTLYQRLSRWLQDAFDRVPGSVLHIEPATLGAWLGAEPGALARATSQLAAEGVVTQRNGHITLLDRAQLAQRSCGCLQPVK